MVKRVSKYCLRTVGVILVCFFIILIQLYCFTKSRNIEDFDINQITKTDHKFYGHIHTFTYDTIIGQTVRNGDIWEPVVTKVLMDSVIPGSVVIDIGAYIGLHSIAMSINNPSIVHSFEAHPESFQLLQMNVSDKKNIIAHHMAISDRKQILTTHAHSRHPTNPGGIAVSSIDDYEIQVPCMALDSYKFTNVSLIKIDVEGHEVQVLKGAKNTIMTNRPVIEIEILGYNMSKSEADFTIGILKDMHYNVQRITNNDFLCVPI